MLRSIWQLQKRSMRGTSPNPRGSWPIVQRLNGMLEDYPGPSFMLYVGSGVATFGVALWGLTAIQFDAPALAIAGVVSKLTKKFRAPVDLSIAAALSNAIPWTNELKLGPLLTGQIPSETSQTTRSVSRVVAFARWAEGPVNKYGAPYMLVHWASGLTTVTVATLCVHKGVDIVGALSHLPFMTSGDGMAEMVSGKASCFAGGMVINTLSLPLRLYLMSLFASPAFKMFSEVYEKQMRTYRSWLKTHLRTNPDAPRRLEIREGPLRQRNRR